jgi:hypothetical protein
MAKFRFGEGLAGGCTCWPFSVCGLVGRSGIQFTVDGNFAVD